MNRTKSVAWTADCTPSGADFTTIKWTDEFMVRTEPRKWTGQILPRLGQIFPRSDETDEFWIEWNRWIYESDGTDELDGADFTPSGQICPRSDRTDEFMNRTEPMNLWSGRNRCTGRGRFYPICGRFYPDRTEPMNVWSGRNQWIFNRTEPMKWTGRLYPIRGRFTPIGRNRWIYESGGTDEFMNRTEPMYWTGQNLPRPGQDCTPIGRNRWIY